MFLSSKKVKDQDHQRVRFWFQSNTAEILYSCFSNKCAASGVNSA